MTTKRWCSKILSVDTTQASIIIMDACDWYEKEYEQNKKVVSVKPTDKITYVSTYISGHTEYVWSQLQDLETILEYIEVEATKEKLKWTKHYLESYQRSLTDKMAERYADGEDSVYAWKILTQRVAYIRNLYLGIMKGLEYLHFQLGHITKLHAVGLEDAVIGDRKN